jgi:hypothetical protein
MFINVVRESSGNINELTSMTGDPVSFPCRVSAASSGLSRRCSYFHSYCRTGCRLPAQGETDTMMVQWEDDPYFEEERRTDLPLGRARVSRILLTC